MPSIIVQGRTLEISEIDYFEVWYNLSENFLTILLEIKRPIPEAHARMVQDVIEQLVIKNPHSPYGKRQITAKWKKLIAGQTPTDEMKNASATLQIYYEWISGKYQEIAEKKVQFQLRIIELHPEIEQKLQSRKLENHT